MTTLTTMICDRCEAVVTSDRKATLSFSIAPASVPWFVRSSYYDMLTKEDLCKDCFDGLLAYLKGGKQ